MLKSIYICDGYFMCRPAGPGCAKAECSYRKTGEGRALSAWHTQGGHVGTREKASEEPACSSWMVDAWPPGLGDNVHLAGAACRSVGFLEAAPANGEGRARGAWISGVALSDGRGERTHKPAWKLGP